MDQTNSNNYGALYNPYYIYCDAGAEMSDVKRVGLAIDWPLQ